MSDFEHTYTVLRPGDRVLMSWPEFSGDASNVIAVKEKLEEAFPGVTFTLTTGTVEAVLRDNHAPRVHTYVLARNINSAHAWCRRNSVQPHSRDVTIATVGDRLRGYVLHDGDRVVFLDPGPGVLESWAVVEQNAEARGVTWTKIGDRP